MIDTPTANNGITIFYRTILISWLTIISFFSAGCALASPKQQNDGVFLAIAKDYAMTNAPKILEYQEISIKITHREANYYIVSVVGLSFLTRTVLNAEDKPVQLTEATGAGVEIYIDIQTLKVTKVLYGQ